VAAIFPYDSAVVMVMCQLLMLLQMSKSVNNVQELGTLANSMTRDYSALAGDCRGAVAASANPQVSYCSK